MLWPLLLVSLLMAAAVYASPAEDVDGYFTYIANMDGDANLANDVLIWRNCTDDGDYCAAEHPGTTPDGYVDGGSIYRMQ